MGSGAGTTEPAGDRWTDAEFDRLAQRGDPVADQVIAEHVALGGVEDHRALVADIVGHLHLPPEQRSAPIQRYLDEQPPLPDWASPELMASSADFFEEFALVIGTALFTASLPEAYASATGARVLTLTTRMVTDPVRRVYETAQMVFDTGRRGGLEPGTGPGYADIRRVRLLHAAVRYLILHDPEIPKTDAPGPYPSWCPARGIPINQEEMLGTLMTFTQVVFEVMDNMGVDHREADARAYLHNWCVAGALLGIDAELLPLELDDARAITAAIRRRQNGPSEDARHLGAALVGAMRASMPFVLRPVPAALVRWNVGPEIAAIDGVTGGAWLAHLFRWSRFAFRPVGLVAQHDKMLRVLSRHVGTALMGAFVQAGRSGDRPRFELPDYLGERVGRREKRWTL